MKIQLNYDPSVGHIIDNKGLVIATYLGLSDHEVKDSDTTNKSVKTLVKLKDAGFTVDEIIALNNKGVL